MDSGDKIVPNKRALLRQPNGYAIAAIFALILSVTWFTAGRGGSACLGGACAAVWLTQTTTPEVPTNVQQFNIGDIERHDVAMPSVRAPESGSR